MDKDLKEIAQGLYDLLNEGKDTILPIGAYATIESALREAMELGIPKPSSEEEINAAVKLLAKQSTAPDSETPDWMENDIRRGIECGLQFGGIHVSAKEYAVEALEGLKKDVEAEIAVNRNKKSGATTDEIQERYSAKISAYKTALSLIESTITEIKSQVPPPSDN